MHSFLVLLASAAAAVLTSAPGALAALNGFCHNDRVPGVCVSTAACRASGGASKPGNCPGSPRDVQCCTKTRCDAGTCRWTNGGTSSCSGGTGRPICPGPDGFKCCLATGTWPQPSIPTNRCKAHVVSAGQRILQQFRGQTKTVYCYANKPGDHGLGLALDLMVGTYNPIGFTMAEWVMNNHRSLKVKYVMWGQRIWDIRVDKHPKQWENWPFQQPKDRGDVTQNHWDHLHISFYA